MKRILLNISGHALSKDAEDILREVYGRVETLAFDEIDFMVPINPQIEKVLASAHSPLDGSVSVAVILPGQSTLAVAVFIYLHGMLGHFPDVCLLQQSDNGAYLPTNTFSIDSRELRMHGRALRQEILRQRLKDERPTE